ncbi:hypothetical protein BsWGS_13912 [Bradybaena similaris]
MNGKDMFKVPQAGMSSRRMSLSSGFELPRFRKRFRDKENDDKDNVSVHSLDVGDASLKKKRKRSLLRVSASLINLMSSAKQKSDADTFKVPSSPQSQNVSPYRPPQPSPAKRRSQLTWVDWISGAKGDSVLPVMSHTDIKRQEAIYELYQGEKDMAEDLINVTKLYRDSFVTLGLMSQTDVNTLFGNIDSLIPVHQDLAARLQGQRKPDGTTQNVGKQIHEWACSLKVYVEYCANQIRAKSIFDEKKNEPSVDDYMQRCLASPFSRKLDLWTLLDGARGRFVKYPLLVRSILKYASSDTTDAGHLEKSIRLIERIIRDADERTGLARCEFSKFSLLYLFDDQKVPEIEESSALVCSGCMKSTKGTKLYLLLFDKVAVVSRPVTQSGRQKYQVYRQPIPAAELVVEDLPDGEVRLGSFRSAFGQGGQTVKNLIRISFEDTDKGQSHTFIVSDEHDKRQWMQAFMKVTSKVHIVRESKVKEKSQNA